MLYYYKTIIKCFLTSKLHFEILKFFPNLLTIELMLFNKFLKNASDLDIYKSVSFLETLASQQCYLKFFYMIEARRRFLCNVCFLTLRNNFLYNFLSYFFVNLSLSLKDNNYFFSFKLNWKFSYKCSINDFSIFSFLPLYYYQWKKTLSFTFTFTKSTTFSLKMLLNSFNFPLINA